jgi:hypothetical protein
MNRKDLKKKVAKIFEKGYINLEMFGIDVYFTTSREDFVHMCEWIKEEPVTTVDGRAMLNIHENGYVMIYIAVFNDSLSTLAHECTHAAMYVASSIGHETHESDEIVPYVVGHLFKKCREKMEA